MHDAERNYLYVYPSVYHAFYSRPATITPMPPSCLDENLDFLKK